MRKMLLLTAAPLLASALAAGPALAWDNNHPANTGARANVATADTNANANAATSYGNDEITDARQTLQNAANVVAKMKSDPDMARILQNAEGVFVVPHLWKGGFIIGGTGGEGVLLVKKDGQWANPVFYGVGSVTFGAQAGGAEGPVAFVLMTPKAVDSFTGRNNFSLNANAGLTIVNYSAKGQVTAGKGDVVTWSNQGGLYAGATVSGADISPDNSMNQAFYGRKVDPKAILAGNVPSHVKNPLATELPG